MHCLSKNVKVLQKREDRRSKISIAIVSLDQWSWQVGLNIDCIALQASPSKRNLSKPALSALANALNTSESSGNSGSTSICFSDQIK